MWAALFFQAADTRRASCAHAPEAEASGLLDNGLASARA